MYKKIARWLAVAVIALGIGFAQAPSASAVSYLNQGNLSVACQLQHGQSGWTAQLEFPSQGGFGWRCWANYSALRSGVNIEYYCQYYYGLHARGGSTAYNWYCGA